MKIDEARITNEIKRKKPKLILLSCPEGYLHQIQGLASKIEQQYGVQTVVSADPCYGSCDTPDGEAARLGADLAFHIGHNSALNQVGLRTVMIDVYDDVDFGQVIQKAIVHLKPYRSIGLCTISQHLHRIPTAKKDLEAAGFKVCIGEGHERLLDGQVMGCRFASPFAIRDQVDAFVFLGQSRFHAVGVALATGRRVFMLDPYLEAVEDLTQQTENWSKKTMLQIYRAVDAKRFGVVIGLKEGQMLPHLAISLKRRIQQHGRDARLITLREVTEERLAPFRDIDAFIQTACPRISIDGESFSRPVLSTPQVEAIFRLWEGGEAGTFLKRSFWV